MKNIMFLLLFLYTNECLVKILVRECKERKQVKKHLLYDKLLKNNFALFNCVFFFLYGFVFVYMCGLGVWLRATLLFVCAWLARRVCDVCVHGDCMCACVCGCVCQLVG